jgi:hypothetical protein
MDAAPSRDAGPAVQIEGSAADLKSCLALCMEQGLDCATQASPGGPISLDARYDCGGGFPAMRDGPCEEVPAATAGGCPIITYFCLCQ